MSEDPVVQVHLLVEERRRRFRLWRLRSFPRRFYRSVRRTVRAATRASALFLAIGGALLSAVGLFLAIATRPFPRGRAGFAIVLALLLLAFVVSGLSVLRMLAAGDLARFLIHGRRTGEILEVVCLRIHQLARAFIKVADETGELPEHLLQACKRSDSYAEKALLIRQAEDSAERIGDLLRNQDINFRRIEALKREAARELQVSHRSLCDYILQFSPTMFRVGVSKYLRNLRELIELTRAEDFEAADEHRFRGLIEQNERLKQDCHERATIQELLLRFDTMHDDVRALASTRSTSGSLQAYSRALARLAKTQHKNLSRRSWRRGWRRWNGSPGDSDYIETFERFLFLYQRQRAHPGFDLHSLLMQAVDAMAGPLRSHFKPGPVRKISTALGAMDQFKNRLARRAPAGKADDDPKHRDRFLARLAAMQHIHRYFNRLVSLSRASMRRPFASILRAWCTRLQNDSIVYVVTVGYSKTVRELIRYGFGPTGLAASKSAQVNLFQLLAGDQDELDTRLMTWELRDIRVGQPLRSAAGGGDMLLSLTRPHDRVLVMLGAEAIDSELRVVHPRSVLDRLSPTVERLTASSVPVLVVVAAEAYKHHDRPFSTGPLFRGHFERVGIYDEALVDLVLGDTAIEPRDWQVLVERRLRLLRP